MEMEVNDITIHYIVHYTLSPEERAKSLPAQVLVSVTDPNKKLTALMPSDPNDLNLPEKWMVKMEDSDKVKGGPNNDVWDSKMIISYNGENTKQTVIGSSTGDKTPHTSIFKGLRYNLFPWHTTPLGHSVFELSIDTFKTRLSDWLKGKSGPVKLSSEVENIDGFNCIRADFFIEFQRDGKTHIYINRRVYFSIEHDYYPVKYEVMTAKSEIVEGNIVKYRMTPHYSHNTASLAEVQEGIYFPTSGFVSEPNEPIDARWQAVGKIIVNQGLKKEDFD
ncbi:MAG: hypothetical protein ACYTFE_02140 [Planctomycetota bacterium]